MKLKDITFEPLDDWDGWYIAQIPELDSSTAEKKALTLQDEASQKAVYCVAGVVDEGYGLYLVPQRGIKYVIEAFEVGSHAGAEAESVYDEIREADNKNSLIPYFADEAGIKAKFTSPVTTEILSILNESLYSSDAMADDDGELDSYIRKHNGVHLWWD